MALLCLFLTAMSSKAAKLRVINPRLAFKAQMRATRHEYLKEMQLLAAKKRDEDARKREEETKRAREFQEDIIAYKNNQKIKEFEIFNMSPQAVHEAERARKAERDALAKERVLHERKLKSQAKLDAILSIYHAASDV